MREDLGNALLRITELEKAAAAAEATRNTIEELRQSMQALQVASQAAYNTQVTRGDELSQRVTGTEQDVRNLRVDLDALTANVEGMDMLLGVNDRDTRARRGRSRGKNGTK
jgi:multidrug resistance efflux pump